MRSRKGRAMPRSPASWPQRPANPAGHRSRCVGRRPSFRPRPRRCSKTAFEMEPDEDPVVETDRRQSALRALAVARVVPAAPPPLAQIRDRVKADLIVRRRARAGPRGRERDRRQDQCRHAAGPGLRPGAARPSAGRSRSPPRRREIARRQRPGAAAAGDDVQPAAGQGQAAPGAERRAAGSSSISRTIVPGDASKEPGLTQAVRQQFAPDHRRRNMPGSSPPRSESELKIKRNEEAHRGQLEARLGAGAQ